MQGDVKSLLGAEKVAVEVTVSDMRNIKDKVGNKKNGYGIEMGKIISNDDVATLVSNSISSELQRRGFRINTGSLSVVVELTRFLNDFKMGFFTGTAAGEIHCAVQIKKPDGSILYAKAIVGSHYEEGIMMAMGSNAKIALEGALVNGISNLMHDEAFIRALLDSGA